MAKEKRESTDRKFPSSLGYALDLLLAGHGWTALELAAAAGVSDGTISAYIWGDSLTRERLEELASLMGLGPEDVSCALLAARLVLPPPPPWSPVDPPPEERRILREAAAMATTELLDLVLDELLRGARHDNRRLALEEGRQETDRLMTYSKADQLLLVQAAPELQQWAVAYVLCADSEAAAPHNPFRALELAELALLVARNVQGSEGLKARLQGWCNGFIGNARRVIGGSLPAAERSFAEAWRLWDLGEDPAGLFSKAYLLDMEASLRRALRQFDRALKLHDDALALALPEEAGSILLNKAFTHQHGCNYKEALQTLAKADASIDAERQPRLRFGVLMNRASCFCLMEKAGAAVPIIDEIKELAELLRNDVDLVRVAWLEASCAAGLGRKTAALAKLNQVRRAFDRKGLPFDYALASLDAASIHRDTGQVQEIKRLAAEMLDIFRSQNVHREALAAALLFQEAAEKERVTAELVRQLKEYLSEAQINPDLTFEAP
jgi:tetratricopeptide (TPR) repeat protein